MLIKVVFNAVGVSDESIKELLGGLGWFHSAEEYERILGHPPVSDPSDPTSCLADYIGFHNRYNFTKFCERLIDNNVTCGIEIVSIEKEGEQDSVANQDLMNEKIVLATRILRNNPDAGVGDIINNPEWIANNFGKCGGRVLAAARMNAHVPKKSHAWLKRFR